MPALPSVGAPPCFSAPTPAAVPTSPSCSTPSLARLTQGLEDELAGEMQALFGKREGTAPIAGSPFLASPSPLRSGPSVPSRPCLIDGRRAQNVAIALAKLRSLPTHTLRLALTSLCPSGIAPDGCSFAVTPLQAALLCDVLPTPEEAAAVQAWANSNGAVPNTALLGEAERFFLAMGDVSQSVGRARVLCTRLGLQARLSEAAARIALIRAAAEEMECRRGAWAKLLASARQAVVGAGASTAVTGGGGGPVHLHHLPALALARLPSLPARDTRGTLMHYTAALLDLSAREELEEVVGAPAPVVPPAPGPAAWRQGASAGKGAALPPARALHPACVALAAAREGVAGLGAELGGMEAEVALVKRMAGAGGGGEGGDPFHPASPAAVAAAGMAAAVAATRAAHGEALAHSASVLAGVGGVQGAAAMETTAAALVALLPLLAGARDEMRKLRAQ